VAEPVATNIPLPSRQDSAARRALTRYLAARINALEYGTADPLTTGQRRDELARLMDHFSLDQAVAREQDRRRKRAIERAAREEAA